MRSPELGIPEAPAVRRGPLQGVRVVDLTRVLAGPFCTQILADMGAEVIKIEDAGAGDQTRLNPPFVDGLSHYFWSVNRNKESMAIDLKNETGRAVLLRLVSKCDVLIENFRPGVMDALGLSKETLRGANPRLIDCSISGFGQWGSMRNLPAFDIITQALSGVMSINGHPGSGGLRLGLPMGDLAGGLWSAIAILGALRHRDMTGEGLSVDYSLLEGLTSLLGYISQLYFITGQEPGPVGNGHHTISPYGCYQTADEPIVVAAMNSRFFEKFCHAVQRPELLSDPRFASSEARVRNRPVLEDIIKEMLATKPRDVWLAQLRGANIPCAPVLCVGDALQQQVLKERGFILDVETANGRDTTKSLGSPIRYKDAFLSPSKRPPEHGEHSAKWLRALEFSDEEIESLVLAGVVKQWSAGERGS